MKYQGESLFNREYFDNWHFNYGKLKFYFSKNNLPTVHVDKELAQWVNIQRRIRHLLPDELKEKLEELNFVI
ncbi:hypothetical protein GCM10027443_12150 [Pontibacter brevis]